MRTLSFPGIRPVWDRLRSILSPILSRSRGRCVRRRDELAVADSQLTCGRDILQLSPVFLTLACDRSGRESRVRRIPYARFGPVRRQLLCIRRAVNDTGQRMEYAQLTSKSLKVRREVVQLFELANERSWPASSSVLAPGAQLGQLE